MALGARAGDVPGTSPVLLARAMTAPRVASSQRAILEAAHRAAPGDPVWTVRVARARFAAGDSGFADSVLPRLLAGSRHPEALLFAAALAQHRGDTTRRTVLLREVLARGGDTAEAEAGLAGVAAQAGRWPEAAAGLSRALASGRGTYRHPFPADALRDALGRLALTGPPRLADSVLATAQRVHPGWATVYEFRATAALRAGRCADAATQVLTLLEFGIEPADAPERLQRCRRGETR
jgi:hypothetical protein